MSVEVCRHCGRPRGGVLHEGRLKWGHAYEPAHIVRCYVVHDYFGCDTGCCGHSVIGVDSADHEIYREFDFNHPYSPEAADQLTFARDLAFKFLPGVAFDVERTNVIDD